MKTIQLEDSNLGRPTSPRIQINNPATSDTIPQALEYKGNWYYNWAGAMEEAKHLGKRLPTKKEMYFLMKNNVTLPLN